MQNCTDSGVKVNLPPRKISPPGGQNFLENSPPRHENLPPHL